MKTRLTVFAGTVRRIVRIFIGWKRMRFGFCPACNDDAPAVDRCLVCNYFRFMMDSNRPKTTREFKRAVWLRFLRWLDEGDNLDDAHAWSHRQEGG